MKKSLSLLILLFPILLFAETIEIKFATLAPEGSTWMKIMREIDKEIQTKTKGEVKFKIYAGGVAGDEKDVIRKIRSNQIHSAAFSGVGLGEILPEVRVMELPFLFKNYEEVDYVNEKMYGKFSEKFEENGFVLLGWAEIGFVSFFSNKPVSSVSDLKGVKMWAWEGDPIANSTFWGLGISPVQLNVADILTSFQTNLIDAAYASPLGAVSLQWHTKTKFVSDFEMADAIGAILVSKKQFAKISPANQKILLDVCNQKLTELVRLSRQDNKKSLDVVLKTGVKLAQKPSPQAEKEFEQAGVKVREKLVGQLYSKETLEEVIKHLETFRKK
ncbi:TRAP transporter substrate-binding protein DctP [bacterium]|nr:TRAP transporter substrate-binding protein DctP [bacterium]